MHHCLSAGAPCPRRVVWTTPGLELAHASRDPAACRAVPPV